MQKFTDFTAAINHLIAQKIELTNEDIANIGLEIELRGEIYL